MYQEWNLENNGLKIKVKNLGFGGEELYINDKLIDKTKTIFGTSRLIAQYEGNIIKVNLGNYKGGMKIDIIINENIIFEEIMGMFNLELWKTAIPTILVSAAAFMIIVAMVGFL